MGCFKVGNPGDAGGCDCGCTITISGTVVTCTGVPLVGAVATVFATGTMTVLATGTTNGTGGYTSSFSASGTTHVDIVIRNSSGQIVGQTTNFSAICGSNIFSLTSGLNVVVEVLGCVGNCANATITIVGPTGGSSQSYSWTTPGIGVSLAQWKLFLPNGAYTYTVTETSGRYSSGSGSFTVTGGASCVSPLAVNAPMVPASGYACFCGGGQLDGALPVKTSLNGTFLGASFVAVNTGGSSWIATGLSFAFPGSVTDPSTFPQSCCTTAAHWSPPLPQTVTGSIDICNSITFQAASLSTFPPGQTCPSLVSGVSLTVGNIHTPVSSGAPAFMATSTYGYSGTDQVTGAQCSFLVTATWTE